MPAFYKLIVPVECKYVFPLPRCLVFGFGFVKCASSPHKSMTAAVAKTGWKNLIFCCLWGRYQLENIDSKGL